MTLRNSNSLKVIRKESKQSRRKKANQALKRACEIGKIFRVVFNHFIFLDYLLQLNNLALVKQSLSSPNKMISPKKCNGICKLSVKSEVEPVSFTRITKDTPATANRSL